MTGKGTPATIAAEQGGVVFNIHEYAHDPLAQSYGREAVDALGLEAARVHKTLIASIERTPRHELVVAVVPVDAQLDLKALAFAVDAKRAEMAKAIDAERSSGYVLGGISPLGQRKPLTTVIDEHAMLFETIFVSAGRRGLEIELAPDDLLHLTNATYAPIAKRQ
jgi:Cys-tRNA(Pro)/Cys-tRNA(Cys) deacylase